VFGRAELILVSIVFYVVGAFRNFNSCLSSPLPLTSFFTFCSFPGTIIEATSTGVKAFSAGAVLYQVSFDRITFPLIRHGLL
jgi:hypothetical protein